MAQFVVFDDLLNTSKELSEHIERMHLTYGSDFFEKARKMLYAALIPARDRAIQSARSRLGENKRHADEAIVAITDKRNLAGNININGSKKGESRGNVSSAGTKKKVRTVSARTTKLQSYTGYKAAFILHFLNSGTQDRQTNVPEKTGRRSQATWGARGMIAPGDWFGQNAQSVTSAGEQFIKRFLDYAADAFENGEF